MDSAYLKTGKDGYVEREVVAVLVHCDTLVYATLVVGIVRAGQAVSRSPSSRRLCGRHAD